MSVNPAENNTADSSDMFPDTVATTAGTAASTIPTSSATVADGVSTPTTRTARLRLAAAASPAVEDGGLISVLPVEVLVYNVFCYLDLEDVVAFYSSCSRWRALLSDDYIWRLLFKDVWPHTFAAVEAKTDSWRTQYVEQYRHSTAWDRGKFTCRSFGVRCTLDLGGMGIRAMKSNKGEDVVLVKTAGHREILTFAKENVKTRNEFVPPLDAAVYAQARYEASFLDTTTGECTMGVRSPNGMRNWIEVFSLTRRGLFARYALEADAADGVVGRVRSVQNGMGILAACVDGIEGVTVRSLETQQEVRRLNSPATRVRFNSSVFSCLSVEERCLRLWDIREKAYVAEVQFDFELRTHSLLYDSVVVAGAKVASVDLRFAAAEATPTAVYEPESSYVHDPDVFYSGVCKVGESAIVARATGSGIVDVLCPRTLRHRYSLGDHVGARHFMSLCVTPDFQSIWSVHADSHLCRWDTDPDSLYTDNSYADHRGSVLGVTGDDEFDSRELFFEQIPSYGKPSRRPAPYKISSYM